MKPPAMCRLLLRAAACAAPSRIRPEWRSRWSRRLQDWWILVERGEITTRSAVAVCRAAAADACRSRCGELRPEKLARGPGIVPAAVVLLLVALAALTRGFPATRALIEVARGHAAGPLHTLAIDGGLDRLVAHCFALAFASVVGVMVVGVGGVPRLRGGWRYPGFLALKTLSATLAVTLLWVEGGPVLRAHIRNPELRVLAGGLVWTLLFIAAFGCALAWSCADQRRRCPVCLRRLALPVSLGCRASVFEPPETEFLCEDGHGWLCLEEGAPGSDRWTPLDPSWRV